MNKITAALAAAALGAGLLGACSTNSPSATEKVCTARADLSKAVDTVKTDISSANFGQAHDHLAAVEAAFDNLGSATKELKAEQAQVLGPQIDALKAQVAGLENAQSLGDLGTGLTAIDAQLQALSKQITTTLTCS